MSDTPALRSQHTPAAATVSRVPALTLALAAVFGLAATTWPLFAQPGSSVTENNAAPWIFALMLPFVLAVALTQITSGGLDPRAIAMLGVLSAAVAAIRPFGAGAGGVETVFFLIILAGRVFGPAFGFLLGTTGLLTSAFLTGGIGPWLPYQMFAAAFIGLGAGLLPGARRDSSQPGPTTRGGRIGEIALLAVYAAVTSLVFGLLLNLSFWPFTVTTGALAYDPAAGMGDNLRNLVVFSLATSLGWDIGRAITTALLIVATGTVLLRVFRRAARKARWV
ncbi:ECF transporter S component [Haloglycomyces albus]|uniref:ECF transporter S component n=1 Tax=Haloglycomyces albus TaxID=526067 RepID=UPI00046CCFC9|nr:ECF transporter S component [Haloglycomyces albus]